MSTELLSQDFSRLLAYLREKTGIRLPETNYRATEEFVLTRMQALDCSFGEYLSCIDSPGAERTAFFSTVTINETYFFREERQFSLLLTRIFPELRLRGSYPVRMWSAACATGEEPLSLYLVAREVFGSSDRFVVYASDLSERALGAFAHGRYSLNALRDDGRPYHPFLQSAVSSSDGTVVVPAEIISRIPRAVVNLHDLADSPFETRFDLVLFRNTVIYLDPEERAPIIERIVDLLEEGGLLLVSATEVPLIGSRALELQERDGVFYFRKKTADEKRAGVVIDAALMTDVQREQHTAREEWQFSAPADFDRAMSFANAKLSNHQFAADHDPSYEVALKLIEILFSINSEEIEAAEQALRELELEHGSHAVVCHLAGCVAVARSDVTAGIEQFSKALRYDPGFWPARYWRAVLSRRKGSPDRARKDAARCMADIDAYIETGSYAYQFLLEGFNGKYFRRICQSWLEKTAKETT